MINEYWSREATQETELNTVFKNSLYLWDNQEAWFDVLDGKFLVIERMRFLVNDLTLKNLGASHHDFNSNLNKLADRKMLSLRIERQEALSFVLQTEINKETLSFLWDNLTLQDHIITDVFNIEWLCEGLWCNSELNLFVLETASLSIELGSACRKNWSDDELTDLKMFV